MCSIAFLPVQDWTFFGTVLWQNIPISVLALPHCHHKHQLPVLSPESFLHKYNIMRDNTPLKGKAHLVEPLLPQWQSPVHSWSPLMSWSSHIQLFHSFPSQNCDQQYFVILDIMRWASPEQAPEHGLHLLLDRCVHTHALTHRVRELSAYCLAVGTLCACLASDIVTNKHYIIPARWLTIHWLLNCKLFL